MDCGRRERVELTFSEMTSGRVTNPKIHQKFHAKGKTVPGILGNDDDVEVLQIKSTNVVLPQLRGENSLRPTERPVF